MIVTQPFWDLVFSEVIRVVAAKRLMSHDINPEVLVFFVSFKKPRRAKNTSLRRTEKRREVLPHHCDVRQSLIPEATPNGVEKRRAALL